MPSLLAFSTQMKLSGVGKKSIQKTKLQLNLLSASEDLLGGWLNKATEFSLEEKWDHRSLSRG